MRMNRRNVLVGLGTIVAGGGGALATGAFSTVEASRNVVVDTTGDGSAFLGITVNEPYAVNSATDADSAVEISLEDSNGDFGFNDNAKTTVSGIITITNNAADGDDIQVSLDESDSQVVAAADLADVTFSLAETDGSTYKTVSAGDTVQLDAVVDTTVDSTTGDESLTIHASKP